MIRLVSVLTWITVIALAAIALSVVATAIIVGGPHDRAFLVPVAAIGAISFLLHNMAEIRHLAATARD
jgi:hypothetical protein